MKIDFIICGFLVVMLMPSCEPKPESAQLLDQLVVSTDYDTLAIFGNYSTYAIPTDTIWLYSNATTDTLLIQNGNSDYPRPVIDAIKSNMNDRGFTEVNHNQDPDLGINVSLIHDYSVYQQVVYGGGGYGYGGGYYGYGGGYYGGGYGGYGPGYISTTTTNRATLIIEIVDLKNRTPDNKVKVLWTANLGDVINALDLEKESTDAVHQSFVQSPYIGR